MNVYFSKKIEENFKKELKHSEKPLVIMKENKCVSTRQGGQL